MIFLGHILSANGISANPEKADKEADWAVPKNAKELHSILGRHLTTNSLYQTLLTWPSVCTN